MDINVSKCVSISLLYSFFVCTKRLRLTLICGSELGVVAYQRAISIYTKYGQKMKKGEVVRV